MGARRRTGALVGRCELPLGAIESQSEKFVLTHRYDVTEFHGMNRIIGSREFTDGSQRAVYQDDEGRQFVIDDEGQAVYGTWLLADTSDTMVS
jgi:hypothetical protein